MVSIIVAVVAAAILIKMAAGKKHAEVTDTRAPQWGDSLCRMN
jgi:hypothetical protein